ncbi:hypothetical protein Poli38472_003072 [Pythium oligandrum]|uniref:Phosphatidylinositol-glycan biosynthesis class F protein n=1 Tax=Pythium oligandrum TaxID=41045 RepID=A0A8K1C6X3_PYTOL|nr:hypothetical protein Poli38472_003072 [Pythium oligandrum]|eukprot:TMW57147.1 hypothetical protein Poli38472_003072 [Pythium oligandrum]
MAISWGVALLMALAPWPCALHLPALALGVTLEQDVDRALPLAVGVIVVLLLIANTVMYTMRGSHAPQRNVGRAVGSGLVGLVVGSVIFHLVIILFGAPIHQLVQRTALLALLISAFTTLPLSLHAGIHWQDWVDIALNARCRDDMEFFITCVCAGSALGAYLGALPIPLDWDRPWQQWPLTCVYGALGGHTVGVVGCAIGMALKQTRGSDIKRD